jgi:hypothetical protein
MHAIEFTRHTTILLIIECNDSIARECIARSHKRKVSNFLYSNRSISSIFDRTYVVGLWCLVFEPPFINNSMFNVWIVWLDATIKLQTDGKEKPMDESLHGHGRLTGRQIRLNKCIEGKTTIVCHCMLLLNTRWRMLLECTQRQPMNVCGVVCRRLSRNISSYVSVCII